MLDKCWATVYDDGPTVIQHQITAHLMFIGITYQSFFGQWGHVRTINSMVVTLTLHVSAQKKISIIKIH